MNARDRILAAIQHPAPEAPPEESKPPAPAEDVDAALRLLATPQDIRAALPPKETETPAQSLSSPPPKVVAGRGARRRLILLAAVVLVGTAGTALLVRRHLQPNVNPDASVNVAAAPASPAPVEKTPSAPEPASAQSAAEVSAPYVVSVRGQIAPPQKPEIQDTPPILQSAEVEQTPKAQETSQRVFTPPPDKPAVTSSPVSLPEPSLALGSAAPAAASLPETVAVPRAPAPPALNEPTPVRAVGGKFEEPHLIKHVAPVFPDLARVSHIGGQVRFRATIGKDGTVRKLERISGPVVLSGAAEQAIRKWVYRPALLDGKPVETVIQIQIDFRLD